MPNNFSKSPPPHYLLKGLLKPLSFLLGVIVLSLSLSYLTLAWTEPSVNPPNNNVSTPLNIGSTGQSKSGGLILNTGGAANGLIVQNGNVGIGTPGPQKKLHVGIARSDSSGILLGNSVDTTSGQYNIDFWGWRDVDGNKPTARIAAIGRWNCCGGYPIGGYAGVVGSDLAFYTSNAWEATGSGPFERMRITQDGNVGIGTTGPGYKLDVAGDIRAQNAWLRTTGNTGWYSDTYGGGWYMQDGTWIRGYNGKSLWMGGGLVGGDGGLTIGYGGAGSPGGGAIIAGNVGIGTASPGAKLDVVGNVRAISTILVPQSSAPTSPVAGQIYYDSTAKAIKIFDGSVWMMITAPEERLAGGLHTPSQCTASGGEVVLDGSDKFCRFNAASCPSTWVQYKSYTTTTSNYCGGSCGDNAISCGTPYHAWSNTNIIETCTYNAWDRYNPWCVSLTCYATRSQIGCY